jgi:hypothetical protein
VIVATLTIVEEKFGEKVPAETRFRAQRLPRFALAGASQSIESCARIKPQANSGGRTIA